MPPKKIKNVENFKKAISIYQRRLQKYNEYVRSLNNEPRRNLVNNLKFDERNFITFVWFMDRPKTDEEFMEKIKEEYDNLQKDFYGTCDRFYDMYENYDFANLKSDTVEDCEDFLITISLCQLHGNIVRDRKDYFEHRYNTQEKREKYDNFVSFIGIYGFNQIDTISEEVGYNYSVNKYEDFESPDSQADKESKEVKCDPNTTKDYDAGLSNSFNIKAPDFFYYFSDIHSNNKNNYSDQINEKYADLKNANGAVINPIISRCINEDSEPYRNISGMDSSQGKCIYIDGKPLTELVKQGDKEPDFKYTGRMNEYLADAIKNCKAVDVVRTYIKDGKANTKIIPLNFSFSKEIKAKVIKPFQEAKVIREHNPIRRFFDFWPFRIKRDPNILEEKQREHENGFNDRKRMIMEHRNGAFLEELNAYRTKHKEPALEVGEYLPSKHEKDNVVNSGIPMNIDSNEFAKESNSKDDLVISEEELANQINNTRGL